MWGWLRWTGESRLYYAACVLLIVAAAGLRFDDLSSEFLTYDEAVAAVNAQGTLSETLENTRTRNSSPILWPLGLWAIQKIESSRVSLRIVPTIASTLTVAALVFILPWSGVRRPVAFLAGALMTVSSAAILEAQDAREYSIDILLATIMIAGAIACLNGKTKWVLLVSMFLAPLIQYGLALFGVVLSVMLAVKKWNNPEKETKGWKENIREISLLVIPPTLALAAGSVITWAITLRYHGTGFAKDGYLQDFYYSGDMTDVSEMVQFIYQGLERMISYHLEVVPSVAFIVIVIVATVMSREFRLSGILILFLLAMVASSVAAVAGMYPLDTERSIFLSPIITLTFSYAAMIAAEKIFTRIPKINSYHPIAYRIASIVIPVAIFSVGFLNIEDYDAYSDPSVIYHVREIIEDQREEGDIVVWSNHAADAVSHYEGSIPSWSRFCDDRKSCMDILRQLPDDVRRLWLVSYGYPYGNGLYGYDLFAHIFDPDLVDVIHDKLVSLRIVHDASRAAEYLRNFEKNEREIVEIPGDIVLRINQYEIYLGERTILYSSDNCDPHATDYVFMLFFPVNRNDLPITAREAGYETIDFRFQSFSNVYGTKCIAVRFLPDYPLERILTRVTASDLHAIQPGATLAIADIDQDFLERLSSPILERESWKVYFLDPHFFYVGSCGSGQSIPPFFLHFYPVDVLDLPAGSRQHGFENRDFLFATDGGMVGTTCVAVREIPDYPIASVHLGQYDETGRIWEELIEWEALRPPPE